MDKFDKFIRLVNGAVAVVFAFIGLWNSDAFYMAGACWFWIIAQGTS